MLTTYTIDGFENIKYQGFGLVKYIESILSDIFEESGYCRVETPTFEAYEFYNNGERREAEDLFKLIDHTGKVLALKPDATLPVTRMAAINHRSPEEIVKLCYQTNIYRHFSSDDPSKHETVQAGVEYFGNPDFSCEGEVIALAIKALERFKIEDIHFDIGHVGYIEALLEELNLEDEEKNELLRFIENKNRDDIRSFLEKKEISKESREALLNLPLLFGAPEEIFARMREFSVNKKMREAVEHLEKVYGYLKDIGLSEFVTVDIGFTNRMNYYTGILFKGYMKNLGEPVIRGGRYDTLSKRFGIDRPACGFALDIMRLFDYLKENTLLPKVKEERILILYQEKERKKAYEIAEERRRGGEHVEMFEYSDRPEALIERLHLNSRYDDAEIFFCENGELIKEESCH